MKVYTKFFSSIFLKSLILVFLVMFSMVFILNLLSELDFFKDLNVTTLFTLSLSFLNSPSMIFEMFPFIFFITTQLFFVKLFDNSEIEILKYSGLENTKIIYIISILSLLIGILITSIFYSISSTMKNIYIDLKSPYTNDGKYLAVITKNGLWIKDEINNSKIIINSSKIDGNFLVDNFITEFDENYEVIQNIVSSKIDITNSEWLIFNATVYKKNTNQNIDLLNLKTNFDSKKIQSLYSNLSSLNIIELYELRKNYKSLNYSTTEINLQILKITSFPIFLVLMTIFSSLVMLKIKNSYNTTVKISIGLFLSVVIYYINNFFLALGNTERIEIYTSVLIPLVILAIINSSMLIKINEK